MIILSLTEYRANGKDYPIILTLGENTIILEAELKPAGPHLLPKRDAAGNITEEGSKPIGTGSFIKLPFGQPPITVRESPARIKELLSPPPAKLPVVQLPQIVRRTQALEKAAAKKAEGMPGERPSPRGG